MALQTKDKQLWLDLYAEAEKLKQLAPWQWMYDDCIFAVEAPGEEDIAYCCVLGTLGEVFGVNIYLGDLGLESYFETRDLALLGEDGSEIIFSQKNLQVLFLNRDMLTEEDRKQISELGLKFRGQNQWIQFRELLPGWFPWYISESRAAFLKTVLEQVIIVAERIKDNPELACHPDEDELEGEVYFIRKAKKQNEQLVWVDDWLHLPAGGNTIVSPVIDTRLEKIGSEIKKYSQGRYPLICFILSVYKPVMDDKMNIPFFPLCILWLDFKSKLILMNELCKVNELDHAILSSLLNIVETKKKSPSQIIVPDAITSERLKTASKILNLPVVISISEQTELSNVRHSMRDFCG